MLPRFLPLFLILPAAAFGAAPVQVPVDSGTLSGASDGNIQTFKGIPYAAPPVGSLRWHPPQPAAPWTGVRDATAFGAACPQATVPDVVDGAPGHMSEDCLTLNIWAPAHEEQPAPVMVWVHGGGNDSGAGSKRYYDGTAFARDGIVLVTINYRLGVLGFYKGNFGLLDQIAALTWVRKNITAFGGDPKNVTLFGESAGGEDVMALLTSPLAAGLFQKAIAESAGWWMHLPNRAEEDANAAKIAVDQDTPVESLVKLESDGLFVDGRVLPMQPEVAFAQGKTAHVSFIIGWNSNEGSLIENPATALARFNPSDIPAARADYGTGADDAALARDIFRDTYFAAPSRWAARQASTQANVYLYHFSYVRERQEGRMIGASHGAEIPYVFDSWRQSPLGGRFLMERDNAEAAMIHACWVSFAKEGRPVCPGAPAWPAYSKENDQLLDFGAATVVQGGLDAHRLDFIESRILRRDGVAQ
jgi:para-nitrobenzyl esterase